MTDIHAMRAATESENPIDLERLATHEDSQVRAYVAENPNTPIHVLINMTHDSSALVQLYILRNKQVTNDLCKIFFNASHPMVKREAFIMAITRYKLGQNDLTHEDLISIIKGLDDKVSNLDLIEIVESIHLIRDKNKLGKFYDSRYIF